MSIFRPIAKILGFGRKRLAIERNVGDDTIPIISEYLPMKSRVNLLNTGLMSDKSKACVPEGMIWRDSPQTDGNCVLGTRRGETWCCEEQNLQFIRDAVQIYRKANSDRPNETLRRAHLWLRSIEDDPRMYWLSQEINIANNQDGYQLLNIAAENESTIKFNVILSHALDFERLTPLIKKVPGHCVIKSDKEASDNVGISFTELYFLVLDNTKLTGFESITPVVVPEDISSENIAYFLDKLLGKLVTKVYIPLRIPEIQFEDTLLEMSVGHGWEISEDYFRKNINGRDVIMWFRLGMDGVVLSTS